MDNSKLDVIENKLYEILEKTQIERDYFEEWQNDYKYNDGVVNGIFSALACIALARNDRLK